MAQMDDSLAAEKLVQLAQRSVSQRKRHYARQPQRAGDVVAQLLAKRGYGAVRSDEQLAAAWTEAVGAAMAPYSRPVGVRRGVLEVTVSASAVMQELTFEKQTLLAAMQQAMPDARIKQLRLRVGQL